MAYVFLDNNLLELAACRLDQLVVWQVFPTQEDVEHQRNALKAQQIISEAISPWLLNLLSCSSVPVRGNFNLELRGLLYSIDDRAVLVGGLQCLSGLPMNMPGMKGVYTSSSSSMPVPPGQHMPRDVYWDPNSPNSKHSSSNSSVVYL